MFNNRHPVGIRLLVLALAAIGLNFAFAPFPLRFLAPIALVPLLRIIDTETPGRAFRYGLFFGSVFFMAHLWWLYGLVVPVERTTRILLDVGVTLLFVALGLSRALRTGRQAPWSLLGSVHLGRAGMGAIAK